MRELGRALQLVGLVLLPVGLLYGLDGGRGSMALEMGFGLGGVAVFLIGRKLSRLGGG